jgi:hypothetical protein
MARSNYMIVVVTVWESELQPHWNIVNAKNTKSWLWFHTIRCWAHNSLRPGMYSARRRDSYDIDITGEACNPPRRPWPTPCARQRQTAPATHVTLEASAVWHRFDRWLQLPDTGAEQWRLVLLAQASLHTSILGIICILELYTKQRYWNLSEIRLS